MLEDAAPAVAVAPEPEALPLSAGGVLVVAPGGQDAQRTVALLARDRIGARVVDGIGALPVLIDAGVSAVLIADEAFERADLAPLAALVAAQPRWSDLPFIVLTRGGPLGRRSVIELHLAEALGNVVFIERPFGALTLVSAVRTAQRARSRQRQVRDQLIEGETAAEALRDGGERMDALVGNPSIGIAQVDPTGAFELSNAGFCRMVQRDEAALRRISLQELIHPGERARSLVQLDELFATGRGFGMEKRLLRPDGSWLWIESRVSAVHDRHGAVQHALAIVQDVTARHEAEAGLRALNETLEARVAAGTEQLRASEAALAQSLKMEAVGRLTGGIAHDFNNLLTAIVGSLELLQKRLADEPRSLRLVSAAFQAALRGAKLTAQLLAFSRNQKLDLKPVDVNAVLASTHELLARTLGPDIELELRLDAALPPAVADLNQLELAILNLALNARDAMPDGGRLTIATGRYAAAPEEEAAGTLRTVCVSVSDNGTGMTPDVLSRALEPFFTTKGVGKGTGLGLSQVYGFARQSGGDVDVQSTVGHGTTVRMVFPAALSAAVAAAPEVVAEAPVSSGRVLVVDDDNDVRQTFVAGLEEHGFTVTQVADGPSALLALEEGLAVDVALLDFAMPVMNGAVVAKAMRALRPGLPVIFASGYSDTAALDAFPGAIVLRKPIRLVELAKVVQATVSGAGRAS